jgi:hypothetical protein
MVRFGARTAVASTFLCAFLLQPAFGATAWRDDFNEACSKTTEAMNLSSGELKGLLEKCDRVEKAIAAEEETVRKVYLKRVQMCRNLYRYVLDAKEQLQPKK